MEQVAVKTLKGLFYLGGMYLVIILISLNIITGLFSLIDLKNLVEESLLMSNLNHPNVMKMIGVCVDENKTPYLVMHYMSQGSLLSFLKNNRDNFTVNDMDDNTERVRQ